MWYHRGTGDLWPLMRDQNISSSYGWGWFIRWSIRLLWPVFRYWHMQVCKPWQSDTINHQHYLGWLSSPCMDTPHVGLFMICLTKIKSHTRSIPGNLKSLAKCRWTFVLFADYGARQQAWTRRLTTYCPFLPLLQILHVAQNSATGPP